MLLKLLKAKILITFLSACISLILAIIGMRALFPQKYQADIESACSKTELSPTLISAIIKTESSFKKDKISSKGAIGLMQIMPDTASYVSQLYFGGVEFDLFNEKDNVLLGVSYLAYLFDKFEDKKTALSAYNAGEGRVYEWLLDKNYSSNGKTLDKIPFKETDDYVKKVIFYEKVYNLLY